MASLKEVKIRINSVSSTRKITSAMKLVASSKLHKAQAAIESMRPYERQLGGMMSRFVSEVSEEIQSPYVSKRKVNKAVIVAISSNSSLCGAFNSNVTKAFNDAVASLKKEGVSDIEVIPIGVKIAEKAKKSGYAFDSNNSKMLDKPAYSEISTIASSLMTRFENKEIDKVIIIYNHFKNTASQVITTETLLPVDLTSVKAEESKAVKLDYIIEPSLNGLVEMLIPKVLYLKLYTAVLDSIASEHSARVIAMQTATDNADELLHDLTLMYNKTRQAAITAELLDIVGGSFK